MATKKKAAQKRTAKKQISFRPKGKNERLSDWLNPPVVAGRKPAKDTGNVVAGPKPAKDTGNDAEVFYNRKRSTQDKVAWQRLEYMAGNHNAPHRVEIRKKEARARLATGAKKFDFNGRR